MPRYQLNMLCAQNTLYKCCRYHQNTFLGKLRRNLALIFGDSKARWYIFGTANQVITGSSNGLSHTQRITITWTNDLLSIAPLGTNCVGIWINTWILSFDKMQLKSLPAKWRPFCFSSEVTINHVESTVVLDSRHRKQMIQCLDYFFWDYNSIVRIIWSPNFDITNDKVHS